MTTAQHDATPQPAAPLAQLAANLEHVLKLRAIPFGMKLFESVEEMAVIPKIRRPKSIHTTDQIVAQAARLGWTVGIVFPFEAVKVEFMLEAA